jgi:hypothetical protein
MAQTQAGKRYLAAVDAAKQAQTVLNAVDRLSQDAGILVACTGNFSDSDFDGTGLVGLNIGNLGNPLILAYLTAYQADVFFQTVIPALNTFMASDLPATSSSYRSYFSTMVQGT